MSCVPLLLAALLACVSSLAGCSQNTSADPQSQEVQTRSATPAAPDVKTDTSTRELVLAGGCFWCMEAAFEQLRGVTEVVSGYAGGTQDTADYRIVSAGLTDHAEAIRIRYDPQVISQQTLLQVFFTAAHDPTQINRQYPDVGRQYRSALFFTDEAQQTAAQQMIDELNASGQFPKPIATTLEPLRGFYIAEDYHQDYVKHHPQEPYVVAHSLPKAAKVREAFPQLIRPQ